VIQSASIERILPHTLRIRVSEREPIAQINVPRPDANGGIELAAYHIDADGCIMLPLDPRERAAGGAGAQGSEQLPVVGGVNPNDVQPGRTNNSPQVQAALQLVLLFDRSPMAGLVDLKRIDVSAPEVLTVTTGQGSEITFGLVDIDRQLRRWREIFDWGQKLNRGIATLDLAVTNNIPTVWQDTNSAPVTPLKAAKPLHPKRKHV